jgi:SAM-dependent methyltransferase
VTDSRNHYSYAVYADRATAEAFDSQRFGGPIGAIVGSTQARVLLAMAGKLHGRSVLDVGTGTGRAAFLLAAAGANVTAVDASNEMLAVARQRALAGNLDVDFREGDAHALRFSDRSFDVVVSLRLLMHSPDWRRALAELCRVARNRVIVDYPSVRSIAAVEAGVRRVTYAVGVRTQPYRVFGGRTVEQAFETNGFEIRSAHRQFVLPIALHKTVGSTRFTTASEALLARLGFLRLFGSPVTVVAERCAS